MRKRGAKKEREREKERESGVSGGSSSSAAAAGAFLPVTCSSPLVVSGQCTRVYPSASLISGSKWVPRLRAEEEDRTQKQKTPLEAS